MTFINAIQDGYPEAVVATKQVSVRLPVEIARFVESRGPIATFIVQAVVEKIAREQQAELEAGFALLAESPGMWDLDFPTGAQQAANALFREPEGQH